LTPEGIVGPHQAPSVLHDGNDGLPRYFEHTGTGQLGFGLMSGGDKIAICELVNADWVPQCEVGSVWFELGVGIANLVTLYSPDMIVLSGSVMKSAPLFLDRIHEVIRRGCRFVPAEKTQLTLASLGDDTNLIGAARVWHYRFGR